ncbi:MAG: hypothetical protein H6643_05580 [Caldilineaceae bacterium]|nr:hypothetical protein [Caldilineaceae bacterium]
MPSRIKLQALSELRLSATAAARSLVYSPGNLTGSPLLAVEDLNGDSAIDIAWTVEMFDLLREGSANRDVGQR